MGWREDEIEYHQQAIEDLQCCEPVSVVSGVELAEMLDAIVAEVEEGLLDPRTGAASRARKQRATEYWARWQKEFTLHRQSMTKEQARYAVMEAIQKEGGSVTYRTLEKHLK